MHLVAQAVIDWLGYLLMAGIPVSIAWWLSDGFAGMFTERGGSLTEVVPGNNPVSQQPGSVVRSTESGAPLSYS